MDKEAVNTDSEDEAFQSADEGEMEKDENGPRPNVDAKTKIEDTDSGKVEHVGQTLANQKESEDTNPSENKSGNDNSKLEEGNVDNENAPILEGVVAPESSELSDAAKAEAVQEDTVEEQADVKKADDADMSSVSLDNNTEKEKEKDEAKTENENKESNDTKEENKSEELLSSQSPIAQAMDRLTMTVDQSESPTSLAESSSSAGWGWGGWGNVISKATTSVSSMLETVETQLGIPNPIEMAKLVNLNDQKEEQQQETKANENAAKDVTVSEGDKPDEKTTQNTTEDSASGLGSWLSGFGVTKISTMVQNTGKDFVSGSLDALEFVGKKTIDVISKGDPGFRRQRTTLSQAIREAKERAENKEEGHAGQEDPEIITFSVEFDTFQGLAHLEALEMISHESEAEIEKILLVNSEEDKKDHENLLAVIKEKFEDSPGNDDDDDEQAKDLENFADIINENISNLSLNITVAKLLASYDSTNAASEKHRAEHSPTLKDLQAEAVTGFAEITARSVEIFHKIGEMMLLPDVKASFLVKNRADSLRKICETLKAYITSLSTRYAAVLDELSGENADDKEISKLITDVYLEASNSSTYIEDSYHLLLPIFQFTAIR